MATDTPDTGTEKPDIETDTPSDEGTGDQPYVGTYKSRTDAEKGLKEKDATITKLSQRLSELEKQANIGEALNKITELHAKADADEKGKFSQAKVDQMVQDLAAAWQEGEDKGARRTLEYVSSVVEDAENMTRSEIEKVKAELRKELDGVKHVLSERDPEWVQWRDEATRIADQLGLDPGQNRDVLLKFAKMTATTQHPPRHDLPGGGGHGRMVPQEAAGITEAEAAFIAQATGRPLTADELKSLNKKYGGR